MSIIRTMVKEFFLLKVTGENPGVWSRNDSEAQTKNKRKVVK
jgi:hypothetical protein